MRFVAIDGTATMVSKCMVGVCPVRDLYSCRHPLFRGKDRDVARDGTWKVFSDGCPLRDMEGWEDAVMDALAKEASE